MNLVRAALAACLVLASVAAPASASIADGTSNTVMLKDLNATKTTFNFQGGCSRGHDVC